MGGERRGEGEAALVRQFQLKEVSQPSLVCRCPPPPYPPRNERTQGGIYQTYMGRRIVVYRHPKAFLTGIWRIWICPKYVSTRKFGAGVRGGGRGGRSWKVIAVTGASGGGGYFFANVKLTFATRKKKEEVFFSPYHTLTFFFLAPEIGKKGKEVLGSLAPLFSC